MQDLYYCYRLNDGSLLPKFVKLEKWKDEYRMAYCNGLDGSIKDRGAQDVYMVRPTLKEMQYALSKKVKERKITPISITDTNPYNIQEGLTVRVVGKQEHYYGDVYRVTLLTDDEIEVSTIRTLRKSDAPYMRGSRGSILHALQRDIEYNVLEIVE